MTEAELMDNLYFELELTDEQGATRTIDLKLDVQRVEVDDAT